MGRKQHWENIYTAQLPNQVGWYQDHPTQSLELIQASGIDYAAHIIDVGAGASTLVDCLLADGFRYITLLDITAAAFDHTRARLGDQAATVTWIEGDITRCPLPAAAYDLWHDRAVFHFLTEFEDQQRYVEAVRHGLKSGGHLVLAAFALDGPPKCSGLDVRRYSPATLQAVFGDDFSLSESRRHTHTTPAGTIQQYIFCRFRKA